MAGKHEKRQYNTTIQTQGLETTTRRLKIHNMISIRDNLFSVATPCTKKIKIQERERQKRAKQKKESLTVQL